MSYAIVTPSYGPDFERCKLLCQSIDRWVEGEFRHYVVVDRRDLPRFGALHGPRTTLLSVESVMPWWLRRAPFARRWWLSLKTPPVRNWILQQLVKLSVGEFLDEPNYVFIDSDVTFIRPFEMRTLSPGGQLRLFRVPGVANKMPHRSWHRTASQLLGLPATDYFGSTYIGNLVTWRRDNLRAMYERIASVARRPWLEAVAHQWALSEYILYGVFVEHVLGPANGQHYTDLPLCHISWNYEITTDADIDRFFAGVQPYHVAVMMSSKQHIDVSRYVRHIAELEVGAGHDSTCPMPHSAARTRHGDRTSSPLTTAGPGRPPGDIR